MLNYIDNSFRRSVGGRETYRNAEGGTWIPMHVYFYIYISAYLHHQRKKKSWISLVFTKSSFFGREQDTTRNS